LPGIRLTKLPHLLQKVGQSFVADFQCMFSIFTELSHNKYERSAPTNETRLGSKFRIIHINHIAPPIVGHAIDAPWHFGQALEPPLVMCANIAVAP